MREPFWLRHDLHVAAIAVAILALGWLVRVEAGRAPGKTIASGRLAVDVPVGWIVEPPAGNVVVARGEDAVTRVELRVDDRPGELVSVESTLELERAQRHGPLYQRLESGTRAAGGRAFLRTTFGYAFKPGPSHAPRLASAVEYAIEDGGEILVVTLHAPEERVAALEREILPTATVRTGP
jgi:hypothetical protein